MALTYPAVKWTRRRGRGSARRTFVWGRLVAAIHAILEIHERESHVTPVFESGPHTRTEVPRSPLLYLTPDIQEEELFLPVVASGRDPVTERDLRPIVAEVDCGRQRRMRRRLTDVDPCP